jgi:drug/metabolite transporter (DMT)-like permease
MDNEKLKNIFTKPINILLFAIISTALWGSAIPAIKIGYELFDIAADDVPTKLLFAGYRFFLAGLMVTIFNWISKRKIVVPKKEEISGIVILGFVQTTLEYIFFYLSLIKLSGVKGSILNSIGNFFAVILAHFMFKNDKLNLTKSLGCLLGFVGVVVCNFENGMDMTFSFTGEGFILIAAFCFALGSVITKIITQNSDSVMITGYQLALGGLILVVIGFVFGGHLIFASIGATLMLLYLALLSAVAFSVWAQLLKFNPVGKISVYCFLNPVFGVILSGIMLGENILNIKSIIALVLVCLGIYIVNRKK